MQLAQPVTLFISVDGVGQSVVLTALNLVLIDDNAHKLVLARLSPHCRLLTLWRNAAYDAAGDYTQAQVEARVFELLGENIQAGLQSLVQ